MDAQTEYEQTELLKLFKKAKREHQNGSEDQTDNDLAFAADELPPARLPNTMGFEQKCEHHKPFWPRLSSSTPGADRIRGEVLVMSRKAFLWSLSIGYALLFALSFVPVAR